ncbi:Heme-binding protein [Lachnellula occidentalis]|uniref:Heme-binding protein n=1 Tax=Lachnellula occidentalis TaxID=215460 RepID=A0A8H8S5H5_9HELO|nr:Heme-binding protein [Lachnellula occidentalis]
MTDNSTIPEEVLSLSNRINSSTRSLHTQLNKLILVRLPLALPPHTANSSRYVSGLLHIAPIYLTFESLWQSILHSPCLPTSLERMAQSKEEQNIPNTARPRNESTPKVCSRTHSLLSHLLLPGLPRADRLRADIQILTGKSEQKIDEELKAISQDGELAKFIAHTKQSVKKNPHVLVAYAWVLYMALFSGGRYLRASLKAAGGMGQNFWDREPSPVRPHAITRAELEVQEAGVVFTEPSDIWSPPEKRSGRGRKRAHSRSDGDIPKITPGLLFFDFIGDADGEDIKLEFKKRIAEAELLLTPGEKDDIIAEAQDIFRFMLQLIGELDSIMETSDEDLEMASLFLQSPNLMTSRNSVFVAQERMSRKLSIAQEPEVTPKSSYLDVLLAGPTAKLVNFRKSLPHVSFEKDAKLKDVGSLERSWTQIHAVMVPVLAPVLAAFAMFLVWYIRLYRE